MIIEKGTPCLYIKITNYDKKNYVIEHKNALEKKGYVWLLKMGQKVKESFLKEIIKKDGVLILKSSPKNGNKFYLCKFDSFKVDDTLYFPDYYNEILRNLYCSLDELKEEASWFRLTRIEEVDNDIIKKFSTISTKKDLYTVALRAKQLSQMYVEANEKIII